MSRSLVNLMAELENRLTGTASSDRLASDVGSLIPDATTYVLFLIDGLGAAQVRAHGGDLAEAMGATLDAPFPSTTTVALSSVATGLEPRSHGIIGHHMWWPSVAAVVNILKWMYPGAGPVDVDTTAVLPSPNLWERLRDAGVEPITVQPAAFETSPLTKMLYRGCRVEPVATEKEMAEATTQLAAVPRRLVFTYLPHVDIAAHIAGRASETHRAAVDAAAHTWSSIARRLPSHTAMVGTADHGHIDYRHDQKTYVERSTGSEFFGDPRALYVRGDGEKVAAVVGGRWVPKEELVAWLGAGPDHPNLDARLPDGVILAPTGRLLIPANMDRRLIGYHGGFDDDERRIPLLIA